MWPARLICISMVQVYIETPSQLFAKLYIESFNIFIYIHVCAHTYMYTFVHVHRAAAQEKLNADDLVTELKSSLEWNEAAMAVVRHVWKEEGPALISMPQETLSVGQVSIRANALHILCTCTCTVQI